MSKNTISLEEAMFIAKSSGGGGGGSSTAIEPHAGSGVPNSSIAAKTGDLYRDDETNKLYQCTAYDETSGSTWVEVSSTDDKMDKIDPIGSGTFLFGEGSTATETEETHSIVSFGTNNIVSSSLTSILGNSNTVRCTENYILGSSNTIQGYSDSKNVIAGIRNNLGGAVRTYILGDSNTPSGCSDSHIVGTSNTIGGATFASVLGRQNTINGGQMDHVIGKGNKINGCTESTVIGVDNGSSSGINGYSQSTIIGYNNNFAGSSNYPTDAVVVGSSNTTTMQGTHAYIFGSANDGALNTASTIIGNGNHPGNCDYSILIGHGNTCSTSYSYTLGNGNILTAKDFEVAVGFTNTIAGNRSGAVGGWNTVSTDDTFVIGNYLTAINTATFNETGAVLVGSYNNVDTNYPGTRFAVGTGTSGISATGFVVTSSKIHINEPVVIADTMTDGTIEPITLSELVETAESGIEAFSGAGIPSSSIAAKVGDVYRDTDTNDLYQCANLTISDLTGRTFIANSDDYLLDWESVAPNGTTTLYVNGKINLNGTTSTSFPAMIFAWGGSEKLTSGGSLALGVSDSSCIISSTDPDLKVEDDRSVMIWNTSIFPDRTIIFDSEDAGTDATNADLIAWLLKHGTLSGDKERVWVKVGTPITFDTLEETIEYTGPGLTLLTQVPEEIGGSVWRVIVSTSEGAYIAYVIGGTSGSTTTYYPEKITSMFMGLEVQLSSDGTNLGIKFANGEATATRTVTVKWIRLDSLSGGTFSISDLPDTATSVF